MRPAEATRLPAILALVSACAPAPLPATSPPARAASQQPTTLEDAPSLPSGLSGALIWDKGPRDPTEQRSVGTTVTRYGEGAVATFGELDLKHHHLPPWSLPGCLFPHGGPTCSVVRFASFVSPDQRFGPGEVGAWSALITVAPMHSFLSAGVNAVYDIEAPWWEDGTGVTRVTALSPAATRVIFEAVVPWRILSVVDTSSGPVALVMEHAPNVPPPPMLAVVPLDGSPPILSPTGLHFGHGERDGHRAGPRMIGASQRKAPSLDPEGRVTDAFFLSWDEALAREGRFEGIWPHIALLSRSGAILQHRELPREWLGQALEARPLGAAGHNLALDRELRAVPAPRRVLASIALPPPFPIAPSESIAAAAYDPDANEGAAIVTRSDRGDAQVRRFDAWGAPNGEAMPWRTPVNRAGHPRRVYPARLVHAGRHWYLLPNDADELLPLTQPGSPIPLGATWAADENSAVYPLPVDDTHIDLVHLDAEPLITRLDLTTGTVSPWRALPTIPAWAPGSLRLAPWVGRRGSDIVIVASRGAHAASLTTGSNGNTWTVSVAATLRGTGSRALVPHVVWGDVVFEEPAPGGRLDHATGPHALLWAYGRDHASFERTWSSRARPSAITDELPAADDPDPWKGRHPLRGPFVDKGTLLLPASPGEPMPVAEVRGFAGACPFVFPTGPRRHVLLCIEPSDRSAVVLRAGSRVLRVREPNAITRAN